MVLFFRSLDLIFTPPNRLGPEKTERIRELLAGPCQSMPAPGVDALSAI